MCSGFACGFFIAGTQTDCNLRADTDTESKFCTGKTSDSAVMASSLIWATKKLSTILYRELTSMEMTIGIAMDKISGKTGRSFINVSFITNLHNSIKLVSVNIHKKTPHNYRKG